MKKETIIERLNKYKPSLPNKLVIELMRVYLFYICILKYRMKFFYHFDTKEYKGKQVILISDHASRDTYFGLTWGFRKIGVANMLVGYQNFIKKGYFWLFRKLGAVPKSLYEPDFRATKNILKLINKGANIGFFPEGIQSTTGSTHPINPSTVGFIKKCNLPVILCKSYGSYLTKPRHVNSTNKGHQEYHFEVLFTPDELSKMNNDEIYNKLLNRFKYNDLEWNKEKQYEYIGKRSNANGLHKIIYYCPKCKTEFNLDVNGNILYCKNCNNKVILDSKFNLYKFNSDSVLPFKDYDMWYKYQRKLVRKEIEDPNFEISYECIYRDIYYDKPRTNSMYDRGKGKIIINHQGISYIGTKDNENVNLFFDIKGVPSYIFTVGLENDIYYKGTYYCFRPIKEGDQIKAVKFMLIVEELHNLVDHNWNKVCRDVYD